MVGLGVCTGGSWWELSMCVVLTGVAFVLIHVWLGLHMCLSLSVGLGVFHQQVGLVGALRISLFEVFWVFTVFHFCPVVKIVSALNSQT